METSFYREELPEGSAFGSFPAGQIKELSDQIMPTKRHPPKYMSLCDQRRRAELRHTGFLPSAFLFLKKEEEAFPCSFISPCPHICLINLYGGAVGAFWMEVVGARRVGR